MNYWILINQINAVHIEPFLSIGTYVDTSSNYQLSKFQGVHNQMVATALVKKYITGKEYDLKIGAMLSDLTAYPENADQKNILLALKHNRLNYFYTDVQFRGSYPQYILRYFNEEELAVQILEEEKSLLKENTLDFLAISYYFSQMVSTETIDELSTSYISSKKNSYIDVTEWGWLLIQMDFITAFQIIGIVIKNKY